MTQPLRPFGPAMTAPSGREALRAAAGAGLGLLLCELVLWLLTPGTVPGQMLLIAPFGASAFLIFGLPNSPLAQPWSVMMGNSLAAGVAVGVASILPDARLAAPVAVAFAILAMALGRAFHPPSGAVALATVVAASDPGFPGLSFVALPVAAGSGVLVLGGILWNRATGRAYPFRQPQAAPTADRRRGLAPEDLAALLDRLRMAPNIGVADLARVLDAAETEAARTHLGGLTAAGVMSRDLVTVAPDTPLPMLAALFRQHGYKTLPVVEGDRYIGLVDQAALLGLTDPLQTALHLVRPVPPLPPTADAAALMTRLAEGGQQAVPICDGPQLIGLVTRSDLIALLATRLRNS